ncbi:mechanosensitive ion channel family protein [bacterium]|nr:mechanosensitive ion channel family protein [bacterium]
MAVPKPTPTPAIPTNAQIGKVVEAAKDSVIKYFENLYAQNSLSHWGGAAIVFVATLGAAFLLRIIAEKRLRTLAVRHKHTLEYFIHRLIRRTHPIFFVTVSIYCASKTFLEQPEHGPKLAFIVTIVVLLQSIVWFNEAIDHVVNEYRRKNLQEDAAGVMTMAALGFVAKLIVCVVIGLLLLVNLGVEIGPLLATVGVVGLAIGLALQNILGDLFASLSIVLDKPFVLGDFIVVDDQMGTVEDIGLKTTRLRSISGEQLIFGNNDLLKSRIRNFKRMMERRVVFQFGVVYQTPVEKLGRIGEMVRDVIQGIGDTRFDRAHFTEFGDSALQFEVVYFVLEPDYNLYRDIQQKINLELMQRFQAESIDFAFPTRTVQVIHSGAPHS